MSNIITDISLFLLSLQSIIYLSSYHSNKDLNEKLKVCKRI
jgi:hypothetical protein